MEEERVVFYRLQEEKEPSLHIYRNLLESRVRLPIALAFPILCEEVENLNERIIQAMETISAALFLWDLLDQQVGNDIKKAYEAEQKAATAPQDARG